MNLFKKEVCNAWRRKPRDTHATSSYFHIFKSKTSITFNSYYYQNYFKFMHPHISREARSTDVLVFKTNLDTPERVNSIKEILDSTSGIYKWNVDAHDCDNVLRIETQSLSSQIVESLLREAGYFCEELPD